jgi:pimeloyl-ACP methyl ester carboxylesterase
LLAPVALLCAMNATGPASAAQQAATPATGQQAVVAYRLPPAVPPETTAIPVRRLKVLDSEMAYRTVGDGEPVLFIHGNPTSSYLWRNVMPYVAGERQAIAVDLIGMGDSGKPRIAYRFVDHMRYLEAFVSALGLQRITLVGHDWGVLPQLVNRPLGETAMTAYRAPFRDPADRAPVLAWPRQVPIAGDPADTEATLETIGAFMGQTAMPVLLLYAEPGVLVPPQAVGWYVERIPRLETAFVGQGLHFIQEDQPDAIGRALRDWIRRN